MNSRWKKGVAGLLAALALQTPAFAAGVAVDGTALNSGEGWIRDGVSYITLRAVDEATPYELSWDGSGARLTGEGLELRAVPGQSYITVNGRALYVAGDVQVVEGKLTLPMGVVAEAVGGELNWDSATGTARMELQGSTPAHAAYEEEDLYWLSRIISAESRGESLLGQMAVGNVVLNRVASEHYPNTVKEVVFDTRYGVQFEPTANGTVYDEPTQTSVLAAKLCLEGARVVGDCLYFYAPALSAGTWIVNNCTYYTTIGCHKFYLP